MNKKTHEALPYAATVLIDTALLSEDEMNAELEKGYKDVKENRVKSIDDAFSDIRRKIERK